MSKETKSICAVIPAAGKGSRLGINTPKILAQITDELNVLDILYSNLSDYANQIVLVVAPFMKAPIQKHIDEKKYHIQLAVQVSPVGMGDAIFCAYEIWKDYKNILIVWGDQISLSKDTISRTVDAQVSMKGTGLTIPIVVRNDLYVEYIFDKDGKLIKVLQKREGDLLSNRGNSDVGMFSLSTNGLKGLWDSYLVTKLDKGSVTEEINFLPFLSFVSTNGWQTIKVSVQDPLEARGLNNPDDLEFFRNHFSQK